MQGPIDENHDFGVVFSFLDIEFNILAELARESLEKCIFVECMGGAI